MKKLILLSAIISFSYLITKAQVRAGIFAGVNSSSVIETNNLPDWNSIKNNYQSRLGFHAGFIADIPFSQTSKFYFQPRVQFSNKGRKYAESFDTLTHDTAWRHYNQFVNYIELPLNIVMKFPLGKNAKFVIGAGPYVSFFYNGKETNDVSYTNGDFTTNDDKDLPVGNGPGKYKTLDYGVNGLAGFEFGRVFLTANYSRGLNNFYQASMYTGNFKHQVLSATIGVFFGSKTKPIIKPKFKDTDKDGIPDKDDACPTEPGTAATNGCPDKDGDGVADKDDACPTEKGTAANKGCPDKDGDGVIDKEDKCPDVPGIAKYKGCPIPDTDGDGLNDEVDKCPELAGPARYNGCPVPDSDGDGVNDEEDKCPQTAGTKENGGCPVIKKEIVERVNYVAQRIQFEYTKAVIRPVSHKILDEVVKVLIKDSSLILSIEGHTSNDGIYAANMKLSQARADNVKAYFISKGINASRLKSQGFGPNQPLNAGKTEADKAKNRRVELKLSSR